MAVDIACVGFGPAMGGFLTTLSRELAESRWVGAAGERHVPRLAVAGHLLRARRRAGLRSLRRGHTGAWDTRQFSRSWISPQIPMAAAGEEGKACIPARSRGSQPTLVSHSRRPTACFARLGFLFGLKHDAFELPYTPALHAEARRPRVVAGAVQPVGQRSSGCVRRGANLAGHAGRRT